MHPEGFPRGRRENPSSSGLMAPGDARQFRAQAGEPSHLRPLILLRVSFVALPAPLLKGRTSLGRVLLTAYLYERRVFDVLKSEL